MIRLMWCYPFVRLLLFCLPPECSHRFVLWLLDKWYWLKWRGVRRLDSRLRGNDSSTRKSHCGLASPMREVWGLGFPNPVGLAAGLDKDGLHIDALFGLGFGFIEVGAVTPQPQPGHPKPRLFRVPAQRALVNRFGFNNLGVDHMVERLKHRVVPGIVGVNIGKQATTPLEQAAEDYKICYQKLYPYADFVTLNISSPNTADLRALQGPVYLRSLLETMKSQQHQLEGVYHRRVPLLVKVSPDLSEIEIEMMSRIFLDGAVDGIIATNTSQMIHLGPTGGVSGQPLKEKTLQVVSAFFRHTQGRIPIIGVGGIASPEDAQALLNAGASLVQIYTGLIYEGPGLVQAIIKNIRYEGSSPNV